MTIPLLTPFGYYHLKRPDEVIGIGPAYPGNKRYPTPTRQLHMTSGQTVYISDTPENLAAILGEDYKRDDGAIAPKRKRGRPKAIPA